MQVVAYTFTASETAYLTSGWNVLDLIIVMISILCTLGDLLANSSPLFAKLQLLKTLRVLRPLRVLSHSPGIKVVISSLFHSLPAVANVFGAVIFFMTLFAVLVSGGLIAVGGGGGSGGTYGGGQGVGGACGGGRSVCSCGSE